jgi:hypothetical protein
VPRFLCRLHVEVRGGVGAEPAPPAAPFKLAKFDNADPDGLGPLLVVAQYTAARDVNGTDAMDALGKVLTFATNNVPALVPAGGRVYELKVECREWPT